MNEKLPSLKTTAVLAGERVCANCGGDPGPNPPELYVVGPNGKRASTSIFWCVPCGESLGYVFPDDHPPSPEARRLSAIREERE